MNCFVDSDGPAKHPALPVDVLGAGIDDHIGSVGKRLLQDRSRKHIVDHQPGASFVGDVGDCGKVDHLEHRVGGRFHKDAFGVRRHGFTPGIEIRAVDQGRPDAKTGQDIGHDLKTGSEKGTGRHEVIPCPELAGERSENGGHAAGGAITGLGALQQRGAAPQTS